MLLEDTYFDHTFKYKIWILIVLNFFCTITFERFVIGNKSIRIAVKRWVTMCLFVPSLAVETACD